MTPKAVEEIKRVTQEQSLDEACVRVSVTGGGCSGFLYHMEFATAESIDELNDNVYEFDGVKAVVDRRTEEFLNGTTVDYQDQLNARGFRFENPNATKGCGCGKSFCC